VSVSAIRYMPCLLVSLVQSSCFIHYYLHVSVVLSCRFTCCHMFIAVMRYMFCLTVMLDILISMVNNLLYVIIITLICGIKMIWKLPNILTALSECHVSELALSLSCILRLDPQVSRH
jgi:hypothetical protein